MSSTTKKSLKVAVIGSGIAGLGAAHTLNPYARVTLFEQQSRFGGHSNTVPLTLPAAQGLTTYGVDTGFLVFNERTYPNLIALFKSLKIPTTESDMSFSVSTSDGTQTLEWAGSNLNSVFAQRINLLRPRFWRMLKEINRLNRLCTALARSNNLQDLKLPLGRFLNNHGFDQDLREWYLLPMLACIWSCPTGQMLNFPVSTMIRFCDNHGLMQVTGRPKWRTVVGGASSYVHAIVSGLADARLHARVQRIDRTVHGVRVVTHEGTEYFDGVVIATHAPQALALLGDVSSLEQRILEKFRTQPNQAILHTDDSVLSRRKAIHSAWNYVATRGVASQSASADPVGLHYLINKLQPLPFQDPVIVSLNSSQSIDPTKIKGMFNYAHPVMDLRSFEGQSQLPVIQGLQNTWFCGAWTKYGFHEDGLVSGQQAAQDIIKRWNLV